MGLVTLKYYFFRGGGQEGTEFMEVEEGWEIMKINQ